MEWHAANDGLRFYQRAVVISGISLTSEEEAEIIQQCGNTVAVDENPYFLKYQLLTPSLALEVSDEHDRPLMHAECKTISFDFDLATRMSAEFKCDDIRVQDRLTTGSRFPCIVGSCTEANAPWAVRWTSGAGTLSDCVCMINELLGRC